MFLGISMIGFGVSAVLDHEAPEGGPYEVPGIVAGSLVAAGMASRLGVQGWF